jgi:hypothetical protein
MLSICPISCGDYLSYVEEEGPGVWVGTGSKILELEGGGCRRLRRGTAWPASRDWKTLRIRQVVDRTYANLGVPKRTRLASYLIW